MPALASGSPNLLGTLILSQIREGLPGWSEGCFGVNRGENVPDGKRCFKIDSPVFQYSMAAQYVPVDGRCVHKVRFTGITRYENIERGAHSYDNLRAFIMCDDERGRQVGDYANAFELTGSSDWRLFDAEFAVPAMARRAQVLVGLHECAGVCFFAKLSLTVTQGNKSFDPGACCTSTHGCGPTLQRGSRGWQPGKCFIL